jgi:phosphatidylglycerophosphate synthase
MSARKDSLRHLPNAISVLRLSSMPVLLWLAWNGAERPFAWLLLAAGCSDLLDGWLARRYGWVSRVGALLDSAADISIVTVVLFAVIMLHPEVFVDHAWIIWSVAGIWALTNLIGIVRYRRLASFHTAFGRFGLMMFGVFALSLFFFSFVPAILYVCGAFCFLAGVESLVLVWMISRWTPNFRGGLPAALRARKIRQSRR